MNPAIWEDGGSVHSYRKLYVIQLIIRFKRLAVSMNETSILILKYQLQVNDTNAYTTTVLWLSFLYEIQHFAFDDAHKRIGTFERFPWDCFTNIQIKKALKMYLITDIGRLFSTSSTEILTSTEQNVCSVMFLREIHKPNGIHKLNGYLCCPNRKGPCIYLKKKQLLFTSTLLRTIF